MPISDTVNVSELVDRRLGAYQVWIIAACFLVALLDGFDSQAIGVTAPLMIPDLHLRPDQLGAVFSASSWGFLAGALLIGPFADRWGRKQFLIAMGLLFSVCTFATPWAQDATSLLWLRFATGIGLGGVAPCFVSIATEYAPRRMRAGLVTVLWTGLPAGGMIVGFLGPVLLPAFGWQGIYYAGGAISLVAVLLVIAAVPESLIFLVTHNRAGGQIARIAARLGGEGGALASPRFIASEQARPGVPVRHLFSEGRAITTLLLWLAFFIDYFFLLGTLIWSPTLLKVTGMPVGQASAGLAFDNVGGVAGCLVAGYLIDRFGPYRILIVTFLASFVSLSLTGYAAPSFVPVAVLETLDGLFSGGAGAGLIAFAAILYPTEMRSTGVGWGLGIGRLGGASGPLLGGALMAAQWTPAAIFVAFGITAVPAALTIWVMQRYAKRRRDNPASVEATAA
jgi:AAHS family 4-hydroxybenzoate transporter-like MFS transporter